jgi:hypothetical protein
MRKALIFVAVLVGTAMILLTPTSALAAMLATLSSTHGRPGDWVLLLSDDDQGRATYAGLSEENHQPIFLAPTTSDPAAACGGPNSQPVGMLQWRGEAAGLAFVIPNRPLADYWLFMATGGECWRLGVDGEPLILTIGTSSAENQEVAKHWTVDSLPQPQQSASKPSPSATPGSYPPVWPWLIAASVSALVLVALFAVLRRPRTPSGRT